MNQHRTEPYADEFEARRLAALDRYAILDTPPEEAFDDLAALAAEICDTPIAVINLIGRDRQWFKAEVGLGVRETPLQTSFCVHALLEEDFLLVPDATQDPRFACNPLVQGEPGLRFYAGALLKTADGLPLGTLCVLDTRPKELGARQANALRRLARQAMAQMELRRLLREEHAASAVRDELLRTVVQDAEERRDAERRLQESEAKFQAIANSVDQMIWSTRPDGYHDFYNDRWYEFTGVPHGSTDGEAWSGMFHPEDQDRAWRVWRRCLETGEPYHIEYRLRHRSGAYRWVLGRAKPVRDETGRITRWFGTCTDIQEIVEAREVLARSREELEREVARRTAERDRIWQLSPDLMCVARVDGTLLSVNPAWGRLLGWDPAWLAGRSAAEIKHPEDAERTANELGRLAEGYPTLNFEDRYRHRDGSWRWISWVIEPEGELIYCIGRDVTAEKAAAAELERAQDALRQAQKMEAVGQLTGGVAHDFNNLLTIIRSSTDLLRRPDLAEERRRRYVDAISDTVDRAAKLTGQLLAFARRQALKPEVFDVPDRVRAIADMLRTIVGSRVRIDTDLACGTCHIEADVSQFETALVNMAVNARDAMDGEGALTIRVKHLDRIPALRGHTGGSGPFVAVSLSDTGSGIPPERLPQIFEPFYTTKEVGKGTGLGLSQVYGFAKQSGGDVGVESELGRGTTFTLYLPRVEPDPDRLGGPESEGQPGIEHGRGRRILVVEDNVEVGRFSTQILEDLGYRTAWAGNAGEALERLAQAEAPFDAVFSDVVMPGMSGVELGREIRARYPGLPVVLTSGYSHVLAEEGRHGFELLQKPYAAEELSRVLRRVMRGRARG